MPTTDVIEGTATTVARGTVRDTGARVEEKFDQLFAGLL